MKNTFEFIAVMVLVCIGAYSLLGGICLLAFLHQHFKNGLAPNATLQQLVIVGSFAATMAAAGVGIIYITLKTYNNDRQHKIH